MNLNSEDDKFKIIEISTQEELDALPKSFEEYTLIQIKASSSLTIFVKVAWENSSVVARENSSVVAWANSSVVARENSSVVAWENSSVVAWENSSVVAWGNSSVVAWENSSVVARENSSVVAWGNSVIRLFNQIKRIVLKKFSVAIAIGFEAKCEFKAETAHLIQRPVATYDKEDFLDIHAKNIQPDGRVLLFKVTQADDTDHYTGKIVYRGKITCPDWDPSHALECGKGFHLSPTEREAKSYHPQGIVKKCLVHPDDFVVYPRNITKVRCREVEVIE